ncbi:hypothetical protein K2173_005633 [Erythroxylum novogranatense]|uniref:START domain-containing protein n=1 Tax=Erythroxylum novogranatense TaxID=1862640 RepID=A0AAV8SQC1_9ROSI|nr:hypothetical protein K2173_005633 [Erythroxylum novogranatense]
MGKSGNISQYRERLDKTLASPELTNHDSLKILIRNQLLRSSPNESEDCGDKVVEKRTVEVSHFLDMLRSASISENDMSNTVEASHGQWKLKDDKEEYRVMYREGPQGTPFHTLLVEGYVDGPIDACLCISWESTLYRKWWPQYTIPPFKITDCKCLKRVRINEQISLVRVKVAWPLSAREAVLNFFLFEHLKDGLVVALLNSISDLKGIDRSTHGFTKDGIPEPKDVVRIDLVGGFAIQKVSSGRSYFRTIANIDLKLDFVPPFLINFISRQLIGSGFRLYQKAVASVSNQNEDYMKALDDVLYSQIREALYSIHEPNGATERKEITNEAFVQLQNSIKISEGSIGNSQQNVNNYDDTSATFPEKLKNLGEPASGEIVEEINEEGKHFNDEVGSIEQEVCSGKYLSENVQKSGIAIEKKADEIVEEESKDKSQLETEGENHAKPSLRKNGQKGLENYNKKTSISPEVEQALKTLEKAISVVREYGSKSLQKPLPGSTNQHILSQENGIGKDPTPLKSGEGGPDKVSAGASTTTTLKIVEKISDEPRNGSGNRDIRHAGPNSLTREVNHNRIAPATPEQYSSFAVESGQVLLSPSTERSVETPIGGLNTQGDKHMPLDANGDHENGLMEGKEFRWRRKLRFCCVSPGDHWK